MLILTTILTITFLVFPYSYADGAEYVFYKEICGYTSDYWYPSMAVDREGMLWLCSEGFVSRFNGVNWEDYTEQSGSADRVSASSDGTIWFAKKGHLARLDGSNWTYFTQADGIPDDQVQALSAAPNNIIWLVFYNYENSYYYLARFNGEKFEIYREGLLQNYIARLTTTPGGGVWIVYRNFFDAIDCFGDNCPKGISFFNGNTFQHFSIDNGLPESKFTIPKRWTNVTWIIYSKERGEVFARCNNYLVRYSDGNWTTLAEDIPNGILVKGQDGRLWQGFLGVLNNNHLMYFEDGKWITYNVNTLRSMIFREHNAPWTSSMAVTPDGTVWLGMNAGILQINPESLTITKVESEIPATSSNEVHCCPNPFNQSATISFELASPCHVEMNIFSVTGQHVKKILSENLGAGSHDFVWDGTDSSGSVVSSGIYLIAVNSKERCLVGSITFVK